MKRMLGRRIWQSFTISTRSNDRQLRNAVLQFEKQSGIVQAIDKDSQQLLEALERGNEIVITTLQKFPVVVEKIRELGEKTPNAAESFQDAMCARQFAIITRDHVRLLFDSLFSGVLQTMIESNFDLYKRINDETDFRNSVITMLFDQVYQDLVYRTG